MKIFNQAICLKIVFIVMLSHISPSIAQSTTERNGFIAQDPLRHIKLSFAVEDSEKDIIHTITDASTSIAFFAKEVLATHGTTSRESMTYVAKDKRDSLRLPPEASNGTDRYVYSNFYCWKLLNPTRLQVNIEWADITTPARYTDSYVFEKIGSKWIFVEHGDLEPFRYQLSGYQFKRPCSS